MSCYGVMLICINIWIKAYARPSGLLIKPSLINGPNLLLPRRLSVKLKLQLAHKNNYCNHPAINKLYYKRKFNKYKYKKSQKSFIHNQLMLKNRNIIKHSKHCYDKLIFIIRGGWDTLRLYWKNISLRIYLDFRWSHHNAFLWENQRRYREKDWFQSRDWAIKEWIILKKCIIPNQLTIFLLVKFTNCSNKNQVFAHNCVKQ